MQIKSLHEALLEAQDYIIKRKEGRAPSLITPFSRLNKVGVDGIPWQSNFVIGARSGVGKTLIKDQILKSAWELNPGENIRVLDFNLEMPLRATGLRNIKSILKCDKDLLLSAGGDSIDKNTLRKIQMIADAAKSTPWDIIDQQPTVNEMYKIISDYLTKHNKNGKMKLIVAVDHSIIIKKAKGQDQRSMLEDYGAMISDVRKDNEVIFFTLSQLNRNILESHRMINGKADNFPKTSDLFGADALLQFADSVLLLNRPAEYGITEYGINKIPILNPNYIGAHLVKSRNGGQGVIHMNANYENFEFHEIDRPTLEDPPFNSNS